MMIGDAQGGEIRQGAEGLSQSTPDDWSFCWGSGIGGVFVAMVGSIPEGGKSPWLLW
ncbi:hypothetical protein [Candidatus Igneacidithiobacillus taiwanensis]|uniref:hypothetical protein n=1 Tax=Candidatus Igneacidithiobacillus taiwanensis TaxID=1945924 RepID=UPI0028A1E2B2|nr:hypothetical protein [Candidatus Igneacidithiobacillus taiwanensis]MCE5359432.1 hypothetical protein [Acidithiobacillus sp.]